MRRRGGARVSARLACLAFALAPSLACWGTVVDVGATARAAEDAAVVDARAPEDAAEAGVVRPLAECRASGVVDRYFSAKELTDRILGGWAQCPEVVSSPLPCLPEAALWGIAFYADATYAILGADREGEAYRVLPGECGSGTFRLFVPRTVDAGPAADGGGAGTAQYVPLDDTVPRNGLEVHLFPEGSAVADVVLVDVEKEPRRLYLREQGSIDTRGYFAPVPAPLR